MTVAPGAADGAGWRPHFYAAVRLRDRLQRDNYTDVVEACQPLLTPTPHPSAAPPVPSSSHSSLHCRALRVVRCADQTLLERHDALRSRLRQQDTDLSQLKSQLSVTLPTSSSFSSPSASLNPQQAAAASAALSSEVASLKEELRHAWRLQAENNATSLRLKEGSERDEKALIAKEDELARARKETEQLRAVLEEREREVRLRESTIEVVRKEYQTVRMALESADKERTRLKNENDVLVTKIMKAKEDQVKQVNELNELVQRKGGAGLTGKERERAEAERRAKEEEDERKRGEMLSVDLDMTSTSAIIDQLSWQQHQPTVVPKERKRTVYVHRGAQCMTVTYSPSGLLVLSGGSDGYVKLLDARSGVIKAQLRGSPDSIMSVAMSADDALMLAAGNDEKARVWALKPQANIGQVLTSHVKDIGSELDKTLHSLSDILPFKKSASTPPTPTAASSSSSSPLPPGAPHPPKVLHTLTGHTSKIYASALDVDSVRSVARAFTGSYDRTLRVWDVHTGQGVKKIMCGSSVNHLSIASGGVGVELIASAHLDSHVRVWDSTSYTLVKDVDDVHHQQVTGVEFSRDGQLLVTTSRDHTVAVIDCRTWQALHTLEGPNKDPYRNLVNWNRATFSPDAQYVVAGGHLGTLYVWQVNTGKCVATLNPSSQYDGSVASLGKDAAEAGSAGHHLAPSTAIVGVDWNRNGRQVISADMAGNVYFWGE